MADQSVGERSVTESQLGSIRSIPNEGFDRGRSRCPGAGTDGPPWMKSNRARLVRACAGPRSRQGGVITLRSQLRRARALARIGLRANGEEPAVEVQERKGEGAVR
jgi:hypothetical protein